VRVPTPFFLIEHGDQTVLVDTGMHPGMRTDPKARIGWVADYIKSDFTPDQLVDAQLERVGRPLSSIDAVVNTHLHYDHCGGNELLPAGTKVIVQAREWAAAHDQGEVEANHYGAADFDGHGHEIVEVDGEHDLFGDGSVLLLPTFGHTPGHQSVLLRAESGDVVLCADACYFLPWIDTEESPPHGRDKEEELQSLRRLRALRDGGARLIPGHDSAFWETLPQAPEQAA
jgi:glyoxylase-like metal-dependent hydrolase (beta-lactamase superfamily II)